MTLELPNGTRLPAIWKLHRERREPSFVIEQRQNEMFCAQIVNSSARYDREENRCSSVPSQRSGIRYIHIYIAVDLIARKLTKKGKKNVKLKPELSPNTDICILLNSFQRSSAKKLAFQFSRIKKVPQRKRKRPPAPMESRSRRSPSPWKRTRKVLKKKRLPTASDSSGRSS